MNYRIEDTCCIMMNNRTDIYLTGEQIVVDQHGNNLSGKSIKFNGFMAELRVGGMLPLDFIPQEN